MCGLRIGAPDSSGQSETEARMPSATVPDWSRESKAFFAWDPSRSLLASIRSYQKAAGSKLPWRVLSCKFAVLRHRIWSVVTGTDIPINTPIEGGLLLPHPNGIVVHPDARIGPNCLLFQQVTLGSSPGGSPVLGGNVVVGAGAKILGPVKVGDHVRIGANAVVLSDVPDWATSAGIPARLLSKSKALDPDAHERSHPGPSTP